MTEQLRFLSEAIKRICAVKSCDAATAQRVLREALAEGFDPPPQWGEVVETAEVAGQPVGRLQVLPEAPPGPGPMWLAANIDFDKETVLEFDLPPGQEPRRRLLLLHSKAIDRLWPKPPEIVADRERSRDNAHESAKQDFKAQWWRTDRVLRWLAWRDPDRINDNWRPALRYQRGTVSDPQPALLRAVQDGTLVAHRHGRPMVPAEWARVELHHLPDVNFNREDVLRVFGEESRLDAAIRRRWPRTDGWERFCDNVRRDLGIAANVRGMSDRTIRRRVGQLKLST